MNLPFGFNPDAAALWLCCSVQTSAALLVAGTATMRLLAWASAPVGTEPRWNRLGAVSWCALLLASVLQLALTAAQMSDLPFGQVFHGHAVVSVLKDTHFGAVWRVRIGLLGGLLVTGLMGGVAQRRASHRLTAIVDIASALLIVSLLASLVAAGHARASEQHVWLLPVDMIHAAAAGAWPGGLLPLMILLAQARRYADLLPAAITITRRFSRLSVASVGLLAMSGSLNAYALIGTFDGLWLSVYGRLIVCKGLLFATMIALGAMNKGLIEQEPMENPHATVSRLWRNVAVECGVAVALLLATEALAMSTPAASSGWETAHFHLINGTGILAADFCTAFQKLTPRADLSSLSLLHWAELFPSAKGLLRPHRAWCPACLAERRSSKLPVYEHLVWTLAPVKICLRHGSPLRECCPRCETMMKPLTVTMVPGHCSRCDGWLGVQKQCPPEVESREKTWLRRSAEIFLI